ncbi:IS256 family transposase [uncultured Dialister sp.]|uniref:IS256 family transposase n=1 Tax=uncultured Dialister sp. TaxID=278064 RepID=UPI0025EFD79A|nr:IS256 family transposase [uncultured Dialister sp.]
MPRRKQNTNVELPAAKRIGEEIVKDFQNRNIHMDTTMIQQFLRQAVKSIVESELSAELDNHLGYNRYDQSSKHKANITDSRNGYSSKTVKSDYGPLELKTPRDRKGTFEPVLVKKNQVDISSLSPYIIKLYARGMTTRDISEQIEEMYGFSLSATEVSHLTDAVLPEIMEWRNRPLCEKYMYIFLDAIYYRIRKDGRYQEVATYVAIGVNMRGERDVLGMWVGAAESASYWAQIMDDLKSRGVKEVLLFAVDGLNGMVEAINAMFPKSMVQRCIVHQIRNCMKLIPYKERREIAKDMKEIYQSPTLEAAGMRLEDLDNKWGRKYPGVIKTWRKNWDELTTMFMLPESLRRLVYTTNAIENFNRGLRKYTKARTQFPSEEALWKSLYLAMELVTNSWSKKVYKWNQIMAEVKAKYPDFISEQDIDELSYSR